MKRLFVAMSVAVVLLWVQAPVPSAAGPSAERLAAPADDFPRPEKLTIGYLPVIFHAQVFGAQEKGWLPFAIIWFHITTTAAAFLIGIISLWLSLYASHAGVRGVERGLLEVAQTLGVTSNLQLLRRVVIPAALPSILPHRRAPEFGARMDGRGGG